MKELLIEKIQQSEIDKVADILVSAFKTNPAYSIIFKKKDQLEKGLSWVFRASLIINNHKQTLTNVIKEKDSGKIIGTFTVIPPQGVETSLSVYSRIGIVGFISRFGVSSLRRMLSLDDCNKTSLTRAIKVPEYYYLSMVAIRHEYRGMGVGSYAIKQAIQEFTSSNPSCRLMGLTTQLAENTVFYSRLGFDIIDEGYINFKEERYYNFNMKLKI